MDNRIKSRKPSTGGKPVRRKHWFAPADGQSYPSESAAVRSGVIDKSFDSWPEAFDFMAASPQALWLVIPIDQTDEWRDRNVARASIWRSARRNKVRLTSEYVSPNLYIALAK